MPVSIDHLSLTTAKAWAKRIHGSLQQQGHPLPLSACQTALAKAMGCSQWTALVTHLSQGTTPIDLLSADPLPIQEGEALNAHGQTALGALLFAIDQGVLNPTASQIEKILDQLGDVCKQAHARVLRFEKRRDQQPIAVRYGEGINGSECLLSHGPYHALVAWATPKGHSQSDVVTTHTTDRYQIRTTLLTAYPHGHDLVLEFMPRFQGPAKDLVELGYSDIQKSRIFTGLKKLGLTLVAGETSSGKQTTLRHILAQYNASNPKHLQAITLQNEWANEENFELRSINQIPPLIKQLTDGHRVLANISHTDSGVGLDHLRDLSSPALFAQLVHHLQTLVYQQLVPLVCLHCATESSLPGRVRFDNKKIDAFLKSMGTGARYHGPGCSHCQGGIVKRVAVAEILTVTGPMRQSLIEDNPVAKGSQKKNISSFLANMKQANRQKILNMVRHGLVDPWEVMRRWGTDFS